MVLLVEEVKILVMLRMLFRFVWEIFENWDIKLMIVVDVSVIFWLWWKILNLIILLRKIINMNGNIIVNLMVVILWW